MVGEDDGMEWNGMHSMRIGKEEKMCSRLIGIRVAGILRKL